MRGESISTRLSTASPSRWESTRAAWRHVGWRSPSGRNRNRSSRAATRRLLRPESEWPARSGCDCRGSRRRRPLGGYLGEERQRCAERRLRPAHRVADRGHKEQQALIHNQQEQIRAEQAQIRAQDAQIKVQQMQIQAERNRGDVQQARIASLTSQVKTIQATLKANGSNSSAIRTVKA